MALPLYIAKQTTATTGTGTLTLNALTDTSLRSFQAAAGTSAVVVRYQIRFATGFEIGIGTYDGGSPGTLTRTTVLASSNAGGLVVLAAGTKDVFLVPDFDRPLLSISGTATATLADLGNLVTFTGSSSATLNLPAIATVPPGSGFHVRNAGTSGAILTLDPSGTETIDGVTTLAMAPGEFAELFRVGSAWVSSGLGAGPVLIRRIVTAASQTVIDFPLPAGFEAFDMRMRGIAAASGNPNLFLRLSTDGGVSFLSGASDYFWGQFNIAAGPSVAAGSFTQGQIQVHGVMQNTLALGHSGEIQIDGAGDAAQSTLIRAFTGFSRAGVGNGPELTSGASAAAAVHNAVRLTISTSVAFQNGGVVSLYGRR